MKPKLTHRSQKWASWDTVSVMVSVAYAGNFYGEFHLVAYGGHLYLMFVVGDVTIWHRIYVQSNVLAKFVDITCVFFHTHFPYFMCHCTENKLSALQVRISEENKLNAATQFITAKISGCPFKQGSKTHPSLRQSNLQLQNEAALMSCRIRAVEHRNRAAGLAGAHPGV